MMSFKKPITLFFILSLLIVLSGCGGGGSSASNPSNTGGTSSSVNTGGTSGTGGTSTGKAILTWNAPTTRSDGTYLNPATDIATYRLYYGTSSGNYTQHVNVTPNLVAPYITTDTITLPLGTYYFVVTTIDAFGQESSYSQEAVKTI